MNRLKAFKTAADDADAETKSLSAASGIVFEKVPMDPPPAADAKPQTPVQIIEALDKKNRGPKGKFINEPNCLVYDWTLGYAMEYIENPPGSTKLYQGRWVYPVRRCWSKSKDGIWDYVVSAFPEPKDMDVSPQSLFRLTHWDNLVKDGFGKGDSGLWEKLATGAMLILAGICIFAIYLLFSSQPVLPA
jgi:hypothetical protein